MFLFNVKFYEINALECGLSTLAKCLGHFELDFFFKKFSQKIFFFLLERLNVHDAMLF